MLTYTASANQFLRVVKLLQHNRKGKKFGSIYVISGAGRWAVANIPAELAYRLEMDGLY